MGAYDPERTSFVASRDKKGHSSSLRVNIPTGTMQALGELVASRRVSHLRTPADCMRDALGRWLEWMVSEGGIETMETDSTLYRINLQLDRQAEVREFNRSTVDKVTRELVSARSPEEMSMAKATALAAAKELKDEAYRFQVEELIQRHCS